MKYRIEVSGYGGEIVIGRVSQNVYDYFDENNIDLEEYASEWDNDFGVPVESQPFPPGQWHSCDDVAHEFGPDPENTFVTVTDSDNNVLLDNIDYPVLIKLGAKIDCDTVDTKDILEADAAYFMGQSYERGLFYSLELETDVFDVSKLTISTTTVDGWELVTNISYNGEDLEDLEDTSTDNKGHDFSMYHVGDY